jgi:hypothetical protein
VDLVKAAGPSCKTLLVLASQQTHPPGSAEQIHRKSADLGTCGQLIWGCVGKQGWQHAHAHVMTHALLSAGCLGCKERCTYADVVACLLLC